MNYCNKIFWQKQIQQAQQEKEGLYDLGDIAVGDTNQPKFDTMTVERKQPVKTQDSFEPLPEDVPNTSQAQSGIDSTSGPPVTRVKTFLILN